MLSSNIRNLRLPLILLLDVIGVIFGFCGAFYLRFERIPHEVSFELIVILCSVILTLFMMGTYTGENSRRYPNLPIATFFKTLFSIIPCVFLVYAFGPERFTQFFGRGVLFMGVVFAGVWVTLGRYFINYLYYWRENNSEILFVGNEETSYDFAENLLKSGENREIIYAFDSSDTANFSDVLVFKYFLKNHADARKWSEIVLAPDYYPTQQITRELVSQRLGGVPVRSLSAFYEYHWFKVPILSLRDDWFYFSQGFSVLSNGFSRRLKRAVDVIISITLLVFTFPMIIFFALLTSLTSKGSALFFQKRVGLNGELFTIYKLRTMHENAEESGAQWAKKSDSRVTALGACLRATRIDELPQLWNVIKGDMSLVGPRPERPEFTQALSKNIPYYDLRHLVKPGLTGWAQVMYPYGASEEDALRKLEYDLYYIKHQSFFFDFNIFVRTVLVVLGRKGR